MSISREALEAGRVDLSDVIGRKPRRIAPIHPGEILRDEFLDPLGVTPYRLAKDMTVPLTRIMAILAGERAITADTALRLARFFGMSAEFWLGLQQHFDLGAARAALKRRLDAEVKPRRTAR
jgi:addiction module HigA family antidote